MNFLRPNALQIRRQSARARGRNQKVTAKIKMQRGQGRIARAILSGLEPFGDWLLRRCGVERIELKRNALKIFLIIRHVRLPQGRV